MNEQHSSPAPRKRRKKAGHRRASMVGKVLGTLALVLVTTCAILAIFATVYIQAIIMPQATVDVESYAMNLSSTIYYNDPDTGEQKELRTLHGEENRVLVEFKDIPKNLINAAIAIEDKRFMEHNGVDWKRTGGAFINMFLGMNNTYGGSTLTQQLIKNMTQNDDVTVKRKILEIFSALEFERNYNKDEIMTWYLNYIFLGQGCYGVSTASFEYFGKKVSDLTLAECASLIGITNNPSVFNPYRNEAKNKERQEVILDEMRAQGYITAEECAAAKAEQLIFKKGSDTTRSVTIYSWYEDQVINDVIADLQTTQNWSKVVATQMVYGGGLSIYTCYNPKAQAAVDAIYEDRENLNYTSKKGQKLESAITVIDNKTGQVAALSGGMGVKEKSLLRNRATVAKRQPGSSLKPIAAYAPAIEMGLVTPATVIDDVPYNVSASGAAWPKNSFGQYRGLTTVFEGLQNSVNTIAVKLVGDYTSPQTAFDFITKNLGMTSPVLIKQVGKQTFSDADLAPMALGGLTDGVTTLEMAAAYAAFPREGIFIPPHTYTKVTQMRGTEEKVLLENNAEPSIAMKDTTAWYMNYLLNNAITNGTGASARLSNMTSAGKTGTTTARKDLYFAGYTPYYTAAVWTGYDTPEVMASSLGNPAIGLWKKVMTALNKDLPNIPFKDPSTGLTSATICEDSGLLLTDACKADPRGSRGKTLQFCKGDEPTQFCTTHVTITVCSAAPYRDEAGAETGRYHLAGEFCPAETRQTVSGLSYERKRVTGVGIADDAYFVSAVQGAGTICPVHTSETPIITPPPEGTEIDPDASPLVPPSPGVTPGTGTSPGTPVTPKPTPSHTPSIDPMDPTTWPDDPGFNPFDRTTWPNA